MTRKRHRLWAMSLCVLALGLVGFGAGAAQAAPPEWMVAGKNINSTENSTLLPSANINLVTTATLHSKIVGISELILCTTSASVGVHFLTGGQILGKLKFSGCTIDLNGVLSKACEPHKGTEKGVIETVEMEGQLALHTGGVSIITLKPKVGETFTVTETSEECSVGEEIPIIGKITVKDVTEGKNQLETELATHEIEEGPLTELWTISKTEEHKASILGKARIFLTLTHVGLKWSGLPG